MSGASSMEACTDATFAWNTTMRAEGGKRPRRRASPIGVVATSASRSAGSDPSSSPVAVTTTSFGSATIPDLLDDHVKPLGVPAWRGALIGHIGRQFTLPIGGDVEIDATAGSIRMLAPAVR